MNIPSLKTIRQWLPLLGQASFFGWVGLLAAFSLFPTDDAAVPGRETKHMPTMAAPAASQGCVTLLDLLICDETGGQQ